MFFLFLQTNSFITSLRLWLTKRFKVVFIICVFSYFSLISLIAQDSAPAILSMQSAVDSALTNSYEIINAHLRIEQSLKNKKSVFHFDNSEMLYRYGQMYSLDNVRYFEMNQNFGSVPSYINQIRRNRLYTDYQISSYDLTLCELIVTVKSAYSAWQCLNAKSGVLSEEADNAVIILNSTDTCSTDNMTGLSMKSLISSGVSEIQLRYQMNSDDLVIAETDLKFLMQSHGNFIPEDSIPMIYMISVDPNKSFYDGSVKTNHLINSYKMSLMQESVEKYKYFPEMKAGFFMQQTPDLKNRSGWQIGITVPLWFPQIQTDLQKAKIENQIAQNNYVNSQDYILKDIENLLFVLTKYFRQIRYYEETALPMADKYRETAWIQFKENKISANECLNIISRTSKTKQEYLEAINNYNQTAFLLELYGK